MIINLANETLNFAAEGKFVFPFGILWAIIPIGIIAVLNIKFWHSFGLGALTVIGVGVVAGIGLGMFTVSGYNITDTQVKNFITWAEEDALLDVNHDQAALILKNQTDEDGYLNRNDDNRTTRTTLTEVKDVYGNKVDVLLVKLDDGEWTIKQFFEKTVSVSPEGNKK